MQKVAINIHGSKNVGDSEFHKDKLMQVIIMGWWETAKINSLGVNGGREVDDSGDRRIVEDNFILDMWSLRCPWKTGWLIQVLND